MTHYLTHLPKVKILIISLIIMMAGQAAFAIQYKPRYNYQDKDIKNLWSLQFAIEDDVTNSDFYGFRFSYMKQLQYNGAVRFNLGLLGVEQPKRYHNVYLGDGSYWVEEMDNDFDVTEGYFSVQYMFYPSMKKGFNLFAGIGPIVSLREPDFEKLEIYWSDRYYDYILELDKSSSKVFGLGLEGSIGLEWYWSKNFSMLAEYGFTLQNEWLLYETDYYNYYGDVITELDSIDEGISLKAKRIKLGVAVHF